MNLINQAIGICLLLAAFASACSLAECESNVEEIEPVKLDRKSAGRSTENHDIVEPINHPEETWIGRQADNVAEEFKDTMKDLRNKVLPVLADKATTMVDEQVDTVKGAAEALDDHKKAAENLVTSAQKAFKNAVNKVENKVNDELGIHIPFVKTIEKNKNKSLLDQVVDQVKGRSARKENSKRSKSRSSTKGRSDLPLDGLRTGRVSVIETVLHLIRILTELGLDNKVNENSKFLDVLITFKNQLLGFTRLVLPSISL